MDRTALHQSLSVMLESATGSPVSGLDEASSLRHDLGLDSVDYVHFVMHLQNELGVELSSDDLERIQMVGELMDLILVRMPAPMRRAA